MSFWRIETCLFHHWTPETWQIDSDSFEWMHQAFNWCFSCDRFKGQLSERVSNSVSSVAQLCLTLWTPWTAACQASLSITNFWSLLKLMSIGWWCHPTISSSVVPFSSCLQSFPESGSFPMSQFFPSSGQSIGISASASILPVNIQDWFPLGLTGWISLQSKGLSRVFSNTTV